MLFQRVGAPIPLSFFSAGKHVRSPSLLISSLCVAGCHQSGMRPTTRVASGSQVRGARSRTPRGVQTPRSPAMSHRPGGAAETPSLLPPTHVPSLPPGQRARPCFLRNARGELVEMAMVQVGPGPTVFTPESVAEYQSDQASGPLVAASSASLLPQVVELPSLSCQCSGGQTAQRGRRRFPFVPVVGSPQRRGERMRPLRDWLSWSA